MYITAIMSGHHHLRYIYFLGVAGPFTFLWSLFPTVLLDICIDTVAACWIELGSLCLPELRCGCEVAWFAVIRAGTRTLQASWLNCV